MPIQPPCPPDPGREIEPHQPPGVVAVALYGALLADALTENTRRSRLYDVAALAHYLEMDDPARALALVFSGTAGQANALALGFRSRLVELGRAAGTVNRHLATLRRAAKLARRMELVPWTLDVDCLRRQPYRDTAGPGHDGWLKILAIAEGLAAAGATNGRRDLAMIRLMHDSGLRKQEMMDLDLADFGPPGSRVAVVGKGSRSRAWVTINAPTVAALAGWAEYRGSRPGPLFNRGTGPRATQRLNPKVVNVAVAKLARVAGVERGCRPHGLRHAGATRLLNLTNGNLRAVQRWTRHVNVNTVVIYDDNRKDMGGELARKLGEDD